MTKSRIFTAVAVTGSVLVLGAGCSALGTEGGSPSASVRETTAANSHALTKRLMAELSTAPTYGKVRAEVRGGNAYLWGTVSTAEARNEAGELAAKLPGVARVYNNIQVGLYTFQD